MYNINMKLYIGRKKEFAILESKWNTEGFSFGVLYGRRRVGKTSLLYNFLKGKKAIFLQSTKDMNYNLLKLSSAIGKIFFDNPDIPPYASFASALSAIVKNAGKERIALVFDEISYLAESDKTILSVLQSFVDQEFRETNLFLILCGSNMSFMERDLLGVNSPVYGRRTFQIKLQPFLINETASMLNAWSLEDIATAHAITEGIPYYLSFFKEHKSIEEAIEAEFFTAGGRLYTESRLYLMMELRSLELYDSILSLLAAGCNEVSIIADKSKKDKSSVSQALQKLTELGIVRKKKKIAGKGIDRGWLFADGYFHFFYRYVYPYSEMIELGSGNALLKKALSELPAFVGHRMENVFHKYILMNSPYLIREIGNMEFPDRETRKSEEIDLVAVTAEGTMLFGECKWKSEPIGKESYEELQRRSYLAFPSIDAKAYYILSRSGFKDDIRKIAEDSNGTITLIEGKDLII